MFRITAAVEAAGLYVLARIRAERPIRVTIPGRAGIARAARIAAALQLPIRLMVRQPTPEVLGELAEVVDLYLHDPQSSAPVEFLQSALAWWLHGDAPTPWFSLELDPDWYTRHVDEPDLTGDAWPPREPGYVSRRLEQLIEAGGECATCRFCGSCQGYFKWPDPAYACDGVKALLGDLEAAAAQIARDLDEARQVRGLPAWLGRAPYRAPLHRRVATQ